MPKTQILNCGGGRAKKITVVERWKRSRVPVVVPVTRSLVVDCGAIAVVDGGAIAVVDSGGDRRGGIRN